MNKRLALIALMGLLSLVALVLTDANVSAQRERPLSEMALQKTDLPEGTQILSAGSTNINDLSQPLNSMNSASFRVHKFLEAYQVSTVGKEVTIANFLYRYQNAVQAAEQAQALTTYALNSKKSQALQPVLLTEETQLQSDVTKGQSIRFADPETGGVYYWFIGVKGRTMILLILGGVPDDRTKATFELLKGRVQQR